MNRDQKRFTISVTPELAAEPTEAEKEEWEDGAGPHRSSFGSPGKRRQTETDRNTVKVRGGRYARCGHPWAAARTRHPMETAEQFWAFLTGSVQSGAGFSPYVIRS